MTSIQGDAFPFVFTDKLVDGMTDLRMDVFLPWLLHGHLRGFFGYGGINRLRVLERASSGEDSTTP